MSFGGRIRFENIKNLIFVLSCLSTKSMDGSSVRPAENRITSESHNSTDKITRKESALPPKYDRTGHPSVRRIGPGRRRAFCLASLTLEASLELPLFLICMILVLHYSVVCRVSTEFSSKMAETAEQMALAAYTKVYDDSNHIIRGALSDTWAYSQVVPKAVDKDAVKNASFLLSSFLKENDRISLVLTYQVKSPFQILKVPLTVWVLKISIRGFTGREGQSGSGGPGKGSTDAGSQVYVTDNGRVYHTDPDCTHLKLTITKIPKSKLKTARNYKGARYKRCHYCGGKIKDGDSVYVNPYGDTYHTSISCSGLTRRINMVSKEDVAGMRECSDCAERRTKWQKK